MPHLFDLTEHMAISTSLFPGELISIGGTGAVYSAHLHGAQPAAVKCFGATRDGEAEMLKELDMYRKVQCLQGVSVPTVLAYGLLDHTFSPFMAMSFEGSSLASSGVTHHALVCIVNCLSILHLSCWRHDHHVTSCVLL